ncbi:nucleolus and neural progenitor protein-like [Argopecten irradians]|uniref:nucleolus and neural progenitor protein-like n=1 Tax=Argopecten irradians TaxID=31199 RepID=UPI003715F062
MWNRKKIIPPLVCNMKTALNSSNKIHFRVMKTTMADISHLLSDMVVWKSELHILSKIVYKKHAQRRREKTLQGLKRIESCLDRICAFEGINFLEDISSSLETVDLDDESVYLPSKQMLQFVLVKLMGLAALLTQTAGYSVHTFIAAQHDLEIGLIYSTVIVLPVNHQPDFCNQIWHMIKCSGDREIFKNMFKKLFYVPDPLYFA